MGKRILFSPIGGTDPIASTSVYEGSMLHICRYYQPDQVVLFLSKEMAERQEKDDRYRYCINELGKRLNHHFEVECIIDKELEDVQIYDVFYQRFKVILQNIQQSMLEGDELILNIASGTPAMKSALLMYAIMSEGKVKAIQVTTPEKSMNEHRGKKDDKYDPQEHWELNQDNDEGATNRCVEVGCPNLLAMLKKNIIIRQVRSYNYAAALLLADEIREYIPDNAYTLLEVAVARQQLDLGRVDELLRQETEDFDDILPVKGGNEKLLFEYTLTLKIKIARKEYGDFMRAISPLLTDLFDAILKGQCKIDIHKYCESKQPGMWSWKKDELLKTEEGKEILRLLDEEFGQFRDGTIVTAGSLKPILMYYLNDDTVKKNVEDMRYIEARIRNFAAHQIMSVTDEGIKRMLGLPNIKMSQIFNKIKNLVVASKVHVKKEDWDSYDQMNERIKECLMEEI